MNGTPSRQPGESLIVLCPIFRVDLDLNRAQDGTSAKTGGAAIENGDTYGIRHTDTAPSKNTHATKHFHKTHHPIVQSSEPGEHWRWCYADELMV